MIKRFKTDRYIFFALVGAEHPVVPVKVTDEIVLGNSLSPHTVVMVTNPECAPCAMSHAVLEDLITKCPGNFKLKIIFKDDPASKERMSTRVAKIIMSEPEQEKRPELLSSGIQKKTKKI